MYCIFASDLVVQNYSFVATEECDFVLLFAEMLLSCNVISKRDC